jgi:hypothetical protein
MLSLTTPLRSYRATSSSMPSSQRPAGQSKERSNTMSIYVRKYSPDHKRIRSAYREFKDAHLEPGSYDPHPPHLHSDWLRTSPANSLRIGKSKTMDLYDLEPLTNKAKNESFRTSVRDKWASNQEFLVSTKTKVKSNTPPYIPEPYYGKSPGKILRGRDKHKELDYYGFRTGRPDRPFFVRKQVQYESKYLKYLVKNYVNEDN